MARKVKDTELYDILGVTSEATDIELKKAYRKKAIQWHPDKNTSPEAESKFKEIGEAYQILSDPDKRAFYDKVGKAGMNKVGEDAEIDPQEIFSKMFGGEAFFDYIGEISLVKDFTSTMDVVMTPEERAEMEAAQEVEKDKAQGSVPSAEKVAAASAGVDTSVPSVNTSPTPGVSAEPVHGSSLAHHSSFSSSSTPTAVGSSSDLSKPTPGKDKKGKPKMTPEQKAKLEALEKKQEAEKKARIDALRDKLIQKIRPFVEAKHPGELNDVETKAFEARMRTEAEDLKLESFGIELLHTIAGVYITKAGNFVKSKKFLGGGFLGRLKEKGGMVKEGWGLLGSAIGVQSAMQEMERLEQKGDATPEEIEALAQDLSGKMLLTTWKATRWEVINVVGAVVEEVLYDPKISKDISLKRAKAIMTIGGIFKSIVPDESDDERRELERLVMNAGNKKKKAEKETEKEKEREKEKSRGWGWGGGQAKAEVPAEKVEGLPKGPNPVI